MYVIVRNLYVFEPADPYSPETGYTNLNDNTEVVNDCTSALRLDPVYVKAINRRGQAREALGGEDNLFLALCGALCAQSVCLLLTLSHRFYGWSYY